MLPITDVLHLDIETFSLQNLRKCGIYRYVECPHFSVDLLTYSFNYGPRITISLAEGETLPQKLIDALTDPRVLKKAWNAPFERTCLGTFLGVYMDPDQWECTMVRAANAGLPLALGACAIALGLHEQKMDEGKKLINYFAKPCKPTKANGNRTRNLPRHNRVKWRMYKRYNDADVAVEMAVAKRIDWIKQPASERRLWVLDQRINDRGVQLDPVLIRAAIETDLTYRGKLIAEAHELTGLENPNSPIQLKQWLSKRLGFAVLSLNKKDMPVLIKKAKKSGNTKVIRMLQIRAEISKSSIKKFEAMINGICEDGRLRGLLQFYGANRTGRWAGRLVQTHNLPRPEVKAEDLDRARRLMRSHDPLFEFMYNVPDALSWLIRTAIIAPVNKALDVSDFSAIEARVIAWLAGEGWRLRFFTNPGAFDIYQMSASMMFGVNLEDIDDELRYRGKVSELALGYGGGPNALINMGALDKGLKETELPRIVRMWRNANPHIVRLWKLIEEAAVRAVQGTPQKLERQNLQLYVERDILFIRLPSGRKLCYQQPRIYEGKFGKPAVCYMTQKAGAWRRETTYGGKLTENIVQAIARDCLAHALLGLYDDGHRIVMHVHDEAIIESKKDRGTLKRVHDIMSRSIPWARGLPMAAKSFQTSYYRKD